MLRRAEEEKLLFWPKNETGGSYKAEGKHLINSTKQSQTITSTILTTQDLIHHGMWNQLTRVLINSRHGNDLRITRQHGIVDINYNKSLSFLNNT